MNSNDDYVKIEILEEPKEVSVALEKALKDKRFVTKGSAATLGIDKRDEKLFVVTFSSLTAPAVQVVDKVACLELADFFKQAAEYLKPR